MKYTNSKAFFLFFSILFFSNTMWSMFEETTFTLHNLATIDNEDSDIAFNEFKKEFNSAILQVEDIDDAFYIAQEGLIELLDCLYPNFDKPIYQNFLRKLTFFLEDQANNNSAIFFIINENFNNGIFAPKDVCLINFSFLFQKVIQEIYPNFPLITGDISVFNDALNEKYNKHAAYIIANVKDYSRTYPGKNLI